MSHSLESTFGSLPRTSRGVAMVMGGDPMGKNFLYTNGNNVLIRDIANPSICEVYTEHSQPTTVAKYSPSGFYIASADNTGKVRIWDTTQKEHILKNQFQPFSGVIKDLAWSPDSQRIVVGGEGRERFGHVFSADTGTSTGEIMGQSRSLNSVDFRPGKPMRIVTASEDNTVAFHHGPPFKFQFSLSDHSRFVNSVRYSPNGDLFASGGADGKIFLYDGLTGLMKTQVGNPAHNMGVYGVSFSPDSSQLLSVSGDKAAKIWDCATASVVQEFTMGSDISDMQVGCLWQGDYILAVSLSGFITYLDKDNPSRPIRTIRGHNKPITAMCVSQSAFTASSDGNICRWDMESGECDLLPGKGHTNQVQDMQVSSTHLVTCAMDDHVIFSKLDAIKEEAFQSKVKVNSQPKRMAVGKDGCVYVAAVNELLVVNEDKVVSTRPVSYEPQCVALHPNSNQIAFGGGDQDKQVHIYKVEDGVIGAEETHTLQHHGALTDLSYSPHAKYLAACDSFRKVLLYELPDYKSVIATEWGHHTAKVTSLDWAPDSKQLCSGALDTSCVVWNPLSTNNYHVIKGAHPNSQVNRVAWLDNDTLLSAGQDCCLKQWKITQ